MKPVEGNFAKNAVEHGVAGLNIDGCRIGETTEIHASKPRAERTGFIKGFVGGTETGIVNHGRWPANVILDGSDEVEGRLPDTHGAGKKRKAEDGTHNSVNKIYGKGLGSPAMRFGDEGSVARFFKQCEADNMKEDEDEKDSQGR